MIYGEVLRELFQSIEENNDILIFESLQKLIQLEREKKNFALANELTKILPAKFQKYIKKLRKSTRITFNVPKDSTRDIPLLEIRNFSVKPNQLILSQKNSSQLNQIILENQKEEILEIYNLKPIRKFLFFGPSGCGKTLAAKLICSQLHIPMVYVRFDGLISSYLGETSSNLKKVFDFVSEGEWVIFFDEFDAIGKTREDYHDNGEMKRVINSFLQMIDNYDGKAILICATNFYQSIDPALWRRFDEIVFFDYPTINEREQMFELFLSNSMKKKVDFKELALNTEKMSGSDIENICIRSSKKAIFENKEVEQADINSEIESQAERNKFRTHFSNKK